MTLIVGAPFIGTSTDPGNSTTLSVGDHYILQPGVVIYFAGSASILPVVGSATGGHNVTIFGTILGNFSGINLGDNSDDFGNRIFVGATGSVSAAGFGAAVFNWGGQASVVNEGLITGQFGVGFASSLGSGSSISNSGDIITSRVAIYSAGSERVTLINSGEITSYTELAFEGGGGADRVINSGIMKGGIDLAENNDTYEGSGGRVVGAILGGAGADTLKGGSLGDVLRGGEQSDVITGRGGRDNLWGDAPVILLANAGADVFDYNAISDSGPSATTRDIIHDFNVGNDRLDLSTIDANTGLVGNQAFSLLPRDLSPLHNGAVGTGRIGWYVVNSANNALDRTIIKINNDADAAIEMQIELVGLKSLNGAPGVDFIF